MVLNIKMVWSQSDMPGPEDLASRWGGIWCLTSEKEGNFCRLMVFWFFLLHYSSYSKRCSFFCDLFCVFLFCFLFMSMFPCYVMLLCFLFMFFSHSDARHPFKNPCSFDHLLFWCGPTSHLLQRSAERYRNHVKEMLTQIISSAEAEMSLDLGPHPMQKEMPEDFSSQRERPLVNHDTTPPMQSNGRMKLCVHLVIWMNLAQEVSDMTVQKTSARTFCHENQNFYDWLIFPY